MNETEGEKHLQQILMPVDLIEEVIRIIENNMTGPALYKLSVINELKSALLDGLASETHEQN
jgi:hypothetical protein